MRGSGIRWVIGAVTALGLVACSGQSTGGAGAGAGAPSAPSTSAPPVTVASIEPAASASKVRMDERVTVKADQGELTSVQVRSAKGEPLEGGFDGTKAQWNSSETLAANTTYTVTVVGTKDGKPVTQTSTFTTLKPTAVNAAHINVGDDQVVGVGMPLIMRFDKPVKDTEAVKEALKIKTTPAVEGAWHWMEPSPWIAKNTQIWYRPKTYWPTGTKVSLTADLGRIELSPGVWGKRTYTSRFTIGPAVIDAVDLAKHTLTVRKNGAVVKVIPITGGKADPQWSTRNGIKVIMEQQKELRMTSSSVGVADKDNPDFYDEIEHWTQRLTLTGEFLHARPGSEGAFGRANISHGCTGMSMTNAQWLFENSRVGDVVTYSGGTRALEWGNGYTAWQMPYEKWAA